ncbi:hypothetical protein [Chitinophaga sp. OAE865]|uniref:hypothetical protein n=1 Tax=Chitinophaga sp. OAE865 TaxID=2817898 RepID=UPI001AE2BB73
METFGHVRMVIGFILSLSIAHLLKGTAKFIQHPDREKPYWIHLSWVVYIFVMLVHFWWWEMPLHALKKWTFPEYIFIISFITTFFLLCALLYPDDLKDYKGYQDYFYSRRKWFFGVLAFSFIADVVDTLIKGHDYYHHFGIEYPIRNVVHIILCLMAIRISNRTFHGALVIAFIIYEMSYILRLYLAAAA